MFRYPMGKLLDMYRKQKPDSSLGRIPTEMEEVASITQLNPLAFIAPDADEEASLNGIWKGRIISSEVYTPSEEESSGGENSMVKCRIPDSGETRADSSLVGFVNGDDVSMQNSDSGTSVIRTTIVSLPLPLQFSHIPLVSLSLAALAFSSPEAFLTLSFMDWMVMLKPSLMSSRG
ncbi:PREDICTED: uncharacterized protein LOC104780605 [Camelina sativa]|uniref:Uncharacterized protein LOC104780605 n=1 Tax=Camelina sativa TaxID=90675 RepID=A0ABM0YMY3_CAMSA|nr:PREDICTED: uncharacterized protein LOC104780605 [Camelina sativa]